MRVIIIPKNKEKEVHRYFTCRLTFTFAVYRYYMNEWVFENLWVGVFVILRPERRFPTFYVFFTYKNILRKSEQQTKNISTDTEECWQSEHFVKVDEHLLFDKK